LWCRLLYQQRGLLSSKVVSCKVTSFSTGPANSERSRVVHWMCNCWLCRRTCRCLLNGHLNTLTRWVELFQPTEFFIQHLVLLHQTRHLFSTSSLCRFKLFNLLQQLPIPFSLFVVHRAFLFHIALRPTCTLTSLPRWLRLLLRGLCLHGR